MTVKIIKEKSVGQVVYVVEGQEPEFTLLTDIFKNILGYKFITFNKNNELNVHLQNSKNEASKIFIVQSKSSAINMLQKWETKKYLEGVYSKLSTIEKLEKEYARYYYLFDRDYKSNKMEEIEK